MSCPGVCVEFPIDGTKGPMETTGSECKLGGGGDGGGDGDGGTGGGGAPYDYPFKNQISPIGVGGAYQEGTTAALKQIDEDLRWFAIKNYGQGKEMVATFNSFSKDLMKVTDALTVQSSSFEEYGKTQFSILTTLGRTEDTLQQLTNCVVNPLNNNCGHLAGSSGGGGDGSSSDDVEAIKKMMESAMSYWGRTANYADTINYTLARASGDIGTTASTLKSINSIHSNLLGQMTGSLAGIKGMMEADLSNRANALGTANNPLHVAGSKYESTLCQGGEDCAFDLGKINKQYDDKKTELKDKYGEIKDEVSQVFKFQFSGSASAPKCFDMFSLFGKSYSVCPEVDGYWETLAAIMMFIFYFIALMVVARR